MPSDAPPGPDKPTRLLRGGVICRFDHGVAVACGGAVMCVQGVEQKSEGPL